MRRLSVVLAFALFITGGAAAADQLSYTPPAAPELPNPSTLLLRLALVTGAALALCFAILWLVRRAQRVAIGKGDPTGRLQVEGSLIIDRRSALHLLRIDGQTTVAITTDPTGLRSLTLLSEPFEAALVAANAGVDLCPSTTIKSNGPAR